MADNDTNIVVPFIVFESSEMRSEKRHRRLISVIIVLIALLFISNAMWLYAWTRYDYETQAVTYTQDGDGNNVIGDGNNVSEIDDYA